MVAIAGAVAAFALNVWFYLPLLIALFLWRRVAEPSRLPREQLSRAIVSGVRYITNSPSIKIVLTRTFLTGLIGGSVSALMPILARDLLHGGAQTYGIMLGAFGLGAVVGALFIGEMRQRMSGEAAVRACALSMGGAIAAVALSGNPIMTAAALLLAGAMWTMTFTLFNIGIQLSTPRWVAGRSLAAYQAASSGGIAVGSWGWGRLTDTAGVEIALLASSVLMLLSPVLGLWLRMPPISASDQDTESLADPEVRLALTSRSGPLVVEIEYRVAQKNARRLRTMDRALLLSNMAGLFASAQPLDSVGARARSARGGFPCWS